MRRILIVAWRAILRIELNVGLRRFESFVELVGLTSSSWFDFQGSWIFLWLRGVSMAAS